MAKPIAKPIAKPLACVQYNCPWSRSGSREQLKSRLQQNGCCVYDWVRPNKGCGDGRLWMIHWGKLAPLPRLWLAHFQKAHFSHLDSALVLALNRLRNPKDCCCTLATNRKICFSTFPLVCTVFRILTKGAGVAWWGLHQSDETPGENLCLCPVYELCITKKFI